MILINDLCDEIYYSKRYVISMRLCIIPILANKIRDYFGDRKRKPLSDRKNFLARIRRDGAGKLRVLAFYQGN